MSMADSTSYPLQPPHERGLVRSVLMAVIMHALLGLFLFYGIRWQNGSPAGAEAELWTDVPEDLQPQVQTPPQRVTVRVAPSLPVQTADIALEQKKRQQQQQKMRDEQLAEQKRAAQQKTDEQRRVQQQQQRQQEDVKREQQRIAQQKLNAQKVAQEKAQQKKLDAERHSRIAQMQRGMGGNSGAAGNGLAKRGSGQGSGGSKSYATFIEKVQRLVLGHVQPWSGPQNLEAIMAVRCAPDGSVLSVKFVRKSGNDQWDENALQAVRAVDPMPSDSDGKTPSPFNIRVCPGGCHGA